MGGGRLCDPEIHITIAVIKSDCGLTYLTKHSQNTTRKDEGSETFRNIGPSKECFTQAGKLSNIELVD